MGTRTPDLLITSELLYQLSYTSTPRDAWKTEARCVKHQIVASGSLARRFRLSRCQHESGLKPERFLVSHVFLIFNSC